MTPLGWSILAISVLAGISIGYFIFRRFPNALSLDRKMRKVVKDPHILLEKLKSHGKIYDEGEEVDFKVGVDLDSGKEIIMVEKKESKVKEIKKEIVRKIPIKKVRKKVKKKSSSKKIK